MPIEPPWLLVGQRNPGTGCRSRSVTRREVRVAKTVAPGNGADVLDFSKHLLIDGYNIVHAWPALRRVMKTEGRDVARAQLVERVRVLHDFDRMRVSVVFDGRGADIAIERPTRHLTFSVLYTPAGMTADDLIEQLATHASEPDSVLVATADRAEGDTISAAGARLMSPEQLLQLVERAASAQSTAVTEHGKKTERQWKRGRR